MEIPTQLQTIISTLSPEESAEVKQLIEELPAGDTELRSLISDNLESLAQVLIDDYSDAWIPRTI